MFMTSIQVALVDQKVAKASLSTYTGVGAKQVEWVEEGHAFTEREVGPRQICYISTTDALHADLSDT
jgi:hypothetical protein